MAPGFIETDMTAGLNEEVRAAYEAAIPLKRMGTAQDVAEAVAFLASGGAAYITGQVLAVNGGMYCLLPVGNPACNLQKASYSILGGQNV